MVGITIITGITTTIGIDRLMASGLPFPGWGRWAVLMLARGRESRPSVSLREPPSPEGEDFRKGYILRPIQMSLPMIWTSSGSADWLGRAGLSEMIRKRSRDFSRVRRNRLIMPPPA